MGDGASFEEGFVEKWPTVFIQRRLADHDERDRNLMEYIYALEQRARNMTTDYRAQDLFNQDQDEVNWLRGHINETVVDYLGHLGIDYPVEWVIQGWPNVNRFGDYHDAHNHPRAYLSGTYYVRVPTTREKLNTRGDERPGCITFQDPRPGVNMGSIRDDPYVDPEYTLRPEAGMLMMWPAFLNHFVHPNLSKQARVSISFNINLKWSDRYLPDQA